MNNKERLLKFIKSYNNICISNILKELNMINPSFYKGRYSLENMQKATDKMREQILCVYPDIKDNKFILDTKEKNIEYAKDIKNIGINKICSKLNIATSALYTFNCSEKKYESVVDEIKFELDEAYKKYNN